MVSCLPTETGLQGPSRILMEFPLPWDLKVIFKIATFIQAEDCFRSQCFTGNADTCVAFSLLTSIRQWMERNKNRSMVYKCIKDCTWLMMNLTEDLPRYPNEQHPCVQSSFNISRERLSHATF